MCTLISHVYDSTCIKYNVSSVPPLQIIHKYITINYIVIHCNVHLRAQQCTLGLNTMYIVSMHIVHFNVHCACTFQCTWSMYNILYIYYTFSGNCNVPYNVHSHVHYNVHSMYIVNVHYNVHGVVHYNVHLVFIPMYITIYIECALQCTLNVHYNVH